jgi:hypothetical protein
VLTCSGGLSTVAEDGSMFADGGAGNGGALSYGPTQPIPTFIPEDFNRAGLERPAVPFPG